MPLISKQPFLSAEVCLTQGWYTLRAGASDASPASDWLKFLGIRIGETSRALLGPGPVLPHRPTGTATSATTEAIGDPATRLAYEPTFVTDDFIARADAIRRNGRGWDIIEVKAGTCPNSQKAADVDDAYLDDVAFTAFVARESGLPLSKISLVLMRSDYRLGRPLNELLIEIDVTARASRRILKLTKAAPRIAGALKGNRPLEAVLQPACKPCPFYEALCLGTTIGGDDPIFLLPNLRGERFEQLRPYQRITALPEDIDLTDAQKRVLAAFRYGELVEPGIIYLDGVRWPAYYLDFEGVGPALPWFDTDEPYEQIPFQYSIHVCDSPGHITAHHEYIAPMEGDWRRELATQLLTDLDRSGSILMYTPYELRMIKYLEKCFPDMAEDLGALELRLFDLEPVFRNGYYHPGFRGYTSIKPRRPPKLPHSWPPQNPPVCRFE